MARAISVKVSTAKVIKALETKLSDGTKAVSNNEKKRKEYQKVEKAWSKEVAKLAVAQIAKAENFSANRRYNNEINIDFNLPAGVIDLPNEPQREHQQTSEWQYKEMVDEIENAIRILKMTDEEVVSTSTYNAIARYL